MKKKLFSLCLVVVLAATAIFAGTLAYFTDTDSADNVFTSGKVDITLVENFDADNATLLPGSANAVKKQVSITLEEGSEDAYVWYEWLIPAVLDSTDGSVGYNNILHVNSYGYSWDKYYTNSKYWASTQTEALAYEQTWDYDADEELDIVDGPEGLLGTETIDGVVYNVYLALYHGTLSAGESTSIAMSQVYLDKAVDCSVNEDGEVVYTINGEVIDFDFSNLHIFVRAYAIQAAGFDSVYDAYAAYVAQ